MHAHKTDNRIKLHIQFPFHSQFLIQLHLNEEWLKLWGLSEEEKILITRTVRKRICNIEHVYEQTA
jgi:hypothetical protein